MREIKLPFDLTPELNTYHHLAHPLGILGGNIPDKTIWFPWLCNKYINCSYTEKPKRSFELYSTDKFFVFDHIIDQIEFQILPDKYEKMLHVTEQSFIETVKALILAGSYIHGMNNERYISAMAPYQKYDFAHDYLLFGVSDESKCFYAAGYTADGKYQEYEIPYHEYYRSIFQPTYKGLSFRILQFNKEKESYTTNFSVVVRDLKHYLNSTAFGAEKNDEKIYGISTWNKLCEYISSTEEIDLRFTKIFMEYHKLMHMRLEYFSKQNIISPSLFEKYITAKSDSNKIYLSSMKYNLTKKESIKSSCLDLIRNVVDLDRNLLPSVISQIEENITIQDFNSASL